MKIKNLSSHSDRIIITIITITLLIVCILTIYPFWYVAIYSISDGLAASAAILKILPVKPTISNYLAVFQNGNIMNGFLVSVSRTVTGAVLHIIVTGLAAYTLSKRKLLFRKYLIPIFLIPMFFTGGLLPYYILITKINLDNNFLVYILPGAFSVFNMLVMKVFFEQLPASLEEAARIDGAGEFTILTKIIMPSSMPIIATILMFVGVDQWNSWFDALIFITKQNLLPLQAILYKIILESQATSIEQIMKFTQNNKTMTPEAIKMTTVMVSTIPIILVYPSLQRYFVKGIMLGAIKG